MRFIILFLFSIVFSAEAADNTTKVWDMESLHNGMFTHVWITENEILITYSSETRGPARKPESYKVEKKNISENGRSAVLHGRILSGNPKYLVVIPDVMRGAHLPSTTGVIYFYDHAPGEDSQPVEQIVLRGKTFDGNPEGFKEAKMRIEAEMKDRRIESSCAVLAPAS